jgi:flap endonuclease-1
MGIKNLLKFLKNYKDLLLEKNIIDYRGKRIAIDISILLYQVIIAIRSSGSDLVNNKGEIVSHVLGLFNKTIILLNNGIIPIYVFDGKPPELKYKVLNNRRQQKLNAKKKMENVETSEEKIKYFKKCVSISKTQLDECRELLTLMGIPYIDAPEEADSQCAYLAKEGLVDAVLSEDMDILTFGSTRIVKNLISQKKNPIEINLNDILDKLELTYDQFIDFCILLGSDYMNGITEINSKIIFEFYNKHKNINDTLCDLKKHKFKVPENLDYDNVKYYFQNSPHIKVSLDDLKLTNINYNEVLNLLVNKHGLIKYKIKNKLNKIINQQQYNTI